MSLLPLTKWCSWECFQEEGQSWGNESKEVADKEEEGVRYVTMETPPSHVWGHFKQIGPNADESLVSCMH